MPHTLSLTGTSDAPLTGRLARPCCRLEIVSDSAAALRKALGPHCGAVGLSTLGTAAVQTSWTDAEEALLEEGMRAWGRDFRQVDRAPPLDHEVWDGRDIRIIDGAGDTPWRSCLSDMVADVEGLTVVAIYAESYCNKFHQTQLARLCCPSAVPARAACCTVDVCLRRSRSSCCRRRVRRTS